MERILCQFVNRFWAMLLLLLFGGITAPCHTQTQVPHNLKYFPKDITRPELISKMRQFSFALGVACTHCHGTEEQTGFELEGVDFALDIKPTKAKARDMLRMLDEINSKLLAAIPGSELHLKVTCFTCHSGLPLPEAIEARVIRMIKAAGLEAALQDYRDVRARYYGSAAYNFEEQPLVEVASVLRGNGQFENAVAISKLNLEFYPESAQSMFELAEAYLKLGDTKNARRLYDKILQLSPGSGIAKRRIDEIDKIEKANGQKSQMESDDH